ncbi:MAG: sigma-70 family RNA polymerase sigma factor [Verrucomicrobia bacterium]|nr:sigma-70 family RNA polymerase sigma factor [Verrucomicrobiota bacterium]
MNTEYGPGVFATTHWSVVLAAGDEYSARQGEALEQLCHNYWYPLYAFIRRRGYDEHEAKDLTQGFFAHLLARNRVAVADASRGKFRTFLLGSVNHFLANEWDRTQRLKRGGGQSRISLDDDDQAEARFKLEALDASPEAQFDRSWAEAVMDSVQERFRRELVEAGDLERFEVLQPFLFGDEGGSYADAAARLGISETGVRSVVHRLRKRFREIVRAEIAQTVARPEDIEPEIRHLFAALGS